MTHVRALPVALVLAAPATGTAAPGEPGDPVALFATCAGRYSAEMEHRWLIGHDAAEITRLVEAVRLTPRQLRAMIDLVDAVRTPDQGPRVLAWRVEAKVAQAMLLQRAEFNTDPADAGRARDLARLALSQCRALIAG